MKYDGITLHPLDIYDMHRVISSDLPPQPAAPQIFFGREEIVGQTVPLFGSDSPCYVALVGSGGMGKTSIGLHIFHHSDLVQKFKLHR